MGVLNKISFGLLGEKSKDPILEGEQTSKDKAEIDDLARELVQSSMPRNLAYSAATQNTFTSITRDAEYFQRHEIYRDSFTREMVKVIIARAIGVTHDTVTPFQLSVSREANLNEKMEELIKEEFKKLIKIIDKNLLEVIIDSQFYGDGYTAIAANTENGVYDLFYNYSTKAFNITPYRTNRGRDIAYEVSANTNLLGKKSRTGQINSGGRYYVTPHKVARLNAQSNGIMQLQTEHLASIENMNVFSDKELPYEDFIYGGVIEGCKDSFDNYIWAVNSLANMRITSSMIERFITHTLESTSETERKLLKAALEKKIKDVRDAVKERMITKDPTPLIANHIIPTTSNNVNSVQIQESTPTFNQNIDDIMFHIKRYIGDIGFNIELTPFGSGQIGGGEKDGAIQNSLQMDAQGEQIRRAVASYITHIIHVHFLSKYNIEINMDYLVIEFTSTLNKAKMDAETQRMEAISNIQQFGGVVDQLKQSGFKDTPDTKVMLREMLRPVIANTSQDKETMLDALVDHILAKPEQPEQEPEE